MKPLTITVAALIVAVCFSGLLIYIAAQDREIVRQREQIAVMSKSMLHPGPQMGIVIYQYHPPTVYTFLWMGRNHTRQHPLETVMGVLLLGLFMPVGYFLYRNLSRRPK